MVGTLSSSPQTFLRHYLQGPVDSVGAGVSGAAQSSSDAAAAAASPAVSSAPGAMTESAATSAPPAQHPASPRISAALPGIMQQVQCPPPLATPPRYKPALAFLLASCAGGLRVTGCILSCECSPVASEYFHVALCAGYPHVCEHDGGIGAGGDAWQRRANNSCCCQPAARHTSWPALRHAPVCYGP